MSETAQMELMREIANMHRVISLLVPTEPAITILRNVTGKLIAGTPPMNTTALMCACRTNFSVVAESAYLVFMSVTISQIVTTAVMNFLATISPAVAISSLAPTASAFIRMRFVTATLTVEIVQMKMDVKTPLILRTVTQVNGLVHSLENASQLKRSVMEL